MRRIFYNACLMCLLLSLILRSTESSAQTVVGVTAYPFPPFINEDMKSGLTFDFAEMLNQHQDTYRFVLEVTSPKRRYRQLESGVQDMILFEMPDWGWEKENITFETSKEIMRGGEVYITANVGNKNQKYFSTLKDKSISAYFGYHYGFADFNSDRDWLQQNFKIGLQNSHERIIDLVVKNKINVGVVTLSYLRKYLTAHPDLNDKIIISEKFDQIYKLRAIIRKAAPISVRQFEKILDDLSHQGHLQALFKKYGLQNQLTYVP